MSSEDDVSNMILVLIMQIAFFQDQNIYILRSEI